MDASTTGGFGFLAAAAMPQTFLSLAAPPTSLPADRLDPTLQTVLGFWLERAAAGRPPGRRDLDPVALRTVLPNIILWDVLDTPEGYRCRLAGSAICDAAERELRGLTLEEMHGPGTVVVRAEFDAVRDRRIAHYVVRTMHWVQKPYRNYARLLLPLLGPAGQVEALLGAITFEPLRHP